MTKNEMFTIVASVLNVPVEELSLDSGPDTIQQWDSLAHITMFSALEGSLGFKFSMSEMLSVKTLSDLIETIEKHNVSVD